MATDKKTIEAGVEKIKRELDGLQVKNLPAPAVLCDECARKTPTRVQAYPAIYCRHSKVGAYFDESLRKWLTISPIENAELGYALGFASTLMTHAAATEAPPDGERH